MRADASRRHRRRRSWSVPAHARAAEPDATSNRTWLAELALGTSPQAFRSVSERRAREIVLRGHRQPRARSASTQPDPVASLRRVWPVERRAGRRLAVPPGRVHRHRRYGRAVLLLPGVRRARVRDLASHGFFSPRARCVQTRRDQR